MPRSNTFRIGKVPKVPFYLTGRAVGQPFSVHAEGERVILTNPDGRQEIDLVECGYLQYRRRSIPPTY